jgi:orc1/cdc6 family replication initiation protein
MPEIFENLLKESSIFANRDALSPHYMPNNLLFREKQIDGIVKYLTPSLRGERGRNLFIYGKTGTGKTSCMKYVIEKIKGVHAIKAKISYINCRIYNSRYRVLSKIVNDHLPSYAKRGYGIVDIYEKIINWIEEDGKILIVVLDEIDVVKDLDDLIYTLTRANSDIKNGGVTIVGISNKISFKEELDPRSISTLYENELVFPPYNSTELAAILKQRAEISFKPGVIDDSSINLAAAIAAKESGDARLALKILSKSRRDC